MATVYVDFLSSYSSWTINGSTSSLVYVTCNVGDTVSFRNSSSSITGVTGTGFGPYWNATTNLSIGPGSTDSRIAGPAGVDDISVSTYLPGGGGSVTRTIRVTINAVADTTPDQFTFTDVTGAEPSTTYESNAITVTGIDASTAVSISGGEYSKNGGAWSTAATTAVLNDTFKVRVTSSASFSTGVSSTLTIGGVSDTYTVTTRAQNAITYSLSAPASINEGSAGTFTFSITGGDGAADATFYWTASAPGETYTGSFTTSSLTKSFTVTPTADVLSEGPETLSMYVYKDSGKTQLAASTSTTIINDTSYPTGGGGSYSVSYDSNSQYRYADVYSTQTVSAQISTGWSTYYVTTSNLPAGSSVSPGSTNPGGSLLYSFTSVAKDNDGQYYEIYVDGNGGSEAGRSYLRVYVYNTITAANGSLSAPTNDINSTATITFTRSSAGSNGTSGDQYMWSTSASMPAYNDAGWAALGSSATLASVPRGQTRYLHIQRWTYRQGSTTIVGKRETRTLSHTVGWPDANQYVTSYCSDYNTYYTYTDGSGGTYDSLISYNSCDGYNATPSAFTLNDIGDKEKDSPYTSNEITVSGLVIRTGESVSASCNAGTLYKNGVAVSGNSTTAVNGDKFKITLTSSSSYSTPVSSTLNIGGRTESYIITTRAQYVTPNGFTFTDASGVALSSVSTSNTITVAGMDSDASVSVTVSGTGKFSKNGAAYTTTATTAANGDTFTLQHTNSGSYATSTSTTLTVGGVSDTYTTTTLVDTFVDAFSLGADVPSAEKNAVTLRSFVVAGLGSGVSVTFTASGSAQVSTDNSTWTTSISRSNGQTVYVKGTASSNYSSTVTCTVSGGGQSDSFTITTRAQDNTPNAFALADLTGQEPDGLVRTCASTVTIAGMDPDSSVTASITGDTGAEFRWRSSSAGTWSAWQSTNKTGVANNYQFEVRVNASSSYSATTSATLTVGGTSSVFSVATRAANTTPTISMPSSISDAIASETYVRPFTISGLEANITLDAGGSATISTSEAGTYSSSIANTGNGTYYVKMTASATAGATVTGNVEGSSWSITTTSATSTTSGSTYVASLSGASFTLRNVVVGDSVNLTFSSFGYYGVIVKSTDQPNVNADNIVLDPSSVGPSGTMNVAFPSTVTNSDAGTNYTIYFKNYATNISGYMYGKVYTAPVAGTGSWSNTTSTSTTQTFNANFSATLGSGSGIAQYCITTSSTAPSIADATWTTFTSNIVNQAYTVTRGQTYYLHIQRRLGETGLASRTVNSYSSDLIDYIPTYTNATITGTQIASATATSLACSIASVNSTQYYYGETGGTNYPTSDSSATNYGKLVLPNAALPGKGNSTTYSLLTKRAVAQGGTDTVTDTTDDFVVARRQDTPTIAAVVTSSNTLSVTYTVTITPGTGSFDTYEFSTDGSTWTTQATAAKSYTISRGSSVTFYGRVSNSTVASLSVNTGSISVPHDTTPDAFELGTGGTSVALSSANYSNTITIAGISTSVTASISGGTMSINGGAYTSTNTSVSADDTIKVRLYASSLNSTTTTATLTVGTVSDTFSVTTLANGAPTIGSFIASPTSVTGEQTVTLSGTSITDDVSIASLVITQQAGTAVTLSTSTTGIGTTSASITATFTTTDATDSLSFVLTATDNIGATAQAYANVEVTASGSGGVIVDPPAGNGYGLQVFDEEGSLWLDVADVLPRIYGTVSGTIPSTGTYIDISLTGTLADGKDFVAVRVNTPYSATDDAYVWTTQPNASTLRAERKAVMGYSEACIYLLIGPSGDQL